MSEWEGKQTDRTRENEEMKTKGLHEGEDNEGRGE